jgi:hypothetical protein
MKTETVQELKWGTEKTYPVNAPCAGLTHMLYTQAQAKTWA